MGTIALRIVGFAESIPLAGVRRACIPAEDLEGPSLCAGKPSFRRFRRTGPPSCPRMAVQNPKTTTVAPRGRSWGINIAGEVAPNRQAINSTRGMLTSKARAHMESQD